MGQQPIKGVKEQVAHAEDVLRRTSDLPGLYGYLESFLRRFRNLSYLLFLIPVVALCCFCMGISLVPGLYLFREVRAFTAGAPDLVQLLAEGCSLAVGFLLYGLTLVFVVPLANFLLPLRLKPFRGGWYSLQTVPWYVHNALTYIVRFTFLDFITPSPLNVLYFRMMGMKIGKGVVINTSYISDPCMITLGDYVTIGGSVTLFAHYGQMGYLIVEPVEIGAGTTVGLRASIMGDVIVGKNVMISPHTVLLPKTRIPDE